MEVLGIEVPRSIVPLLNDFKDQPLRDPAGFVGKAPTVNRRLLLALEEVDLNRRFRQRDNDHLPPGGCWRRGGHWRSWRLPWVFRNAGNQSTKFHI